MWRTPETVQGGIVSNDGLESLVNGDKRPSGQHRQMRLHDQVRDARLWGLLHTPRANSAMSTELSDKCASHKHPNLEVKIAQLLPTPNTLDGMPPKSDKAIEKEMTVSRPGRKQLSNLRDVVVRQMLPTPTASDYKGSRSPEAMIKSGRNPMTNRLTDAIAHTGTYDPKDYRLNPEFVREMMGYPPNWLDV